MAGGYCAEAIDVQGVEVVRNANWAQSDELASLACALDAQADLIERCHGKIMARMGYKLAFQKVDEAA